MLDGVVRTTAKVLPPNNLLWVMASVESVILHSSGILADYFVSSTLPAQRPDGTQSSLSLLDLPLVLIK